MVSLRWMRLAVLSAALTTHLGSPAGAGASDEPKRTKFSEQELRAALERAPRWARTRPNPYAGQPAAQRAGEKLFHQHCAGCHGPQAEGGRRGPALARPFITDAAPGVLFWFLTNGNIARGMPSWSKLPEQQRWQLVTFLKAIGQTSAFKKD